jgi:magnesium-transporting ATPase (P-type)
LVSLVSAYQERSFAEDVERLQERAESVEWLVDALASHPRNGISSAEEDLAARRRAFGTNEKAVKEPQSFFSLLIEALDDFILKILLVAACLSIALEVGMASNEDRKLAWLEGFAILVAVFVCASVTAINNYQK